MTNNIVEKLEVPNARFVLFNFNLLRFSWYFENWQKLKLEHNFDVN